MMGTRLTAVIVLKCMEILTHHVVYQESTVSLYQKTILLVVLTNKVIEKRLDLWFPEVRIGGWKKVELDEGDQNAQRSSSKY